MKNRHFDFAAFHMELPLDLLLRITGQNIGKKIILYIEKIVQKKGNSFFLRNTLSREMVSGGEK